MQNGWDIASVPAKAGRKIIGERLSHGLKAIQSGRPLRDSSGVFEQALSYEGAHGCHAFAAPMQKPALLKIAAKACLPALPCDTNC
jgi:hypothetical protein